METNLEDTTMKRLLTLMFFAAALVGCGSIPTGVKTALPDNLRGNLNVTEINVTTSDSLKGTGVADKVSAALKDELDDVKQGDKDVVFNVEVMNWSEPKGGAMTKLMGSASKAHGIVKVKDMDGNLLTHYEFFVEDTQGGLIGGTVNFADAQKAMMDKFVHFAYDGIQ